MSMTNFVSVRDQSLGTEEKAKQIYLSQNKNKKIINYQQDETDCLSILIRFVDLIQIVIRKEFSISQS